MVEQLRTKADEEAVPVVLGDMTTATAPGAGSFQLVYLVYNAISVLQTQPEQVECFLAMQPATLHPVAGS